MRVFIINSMSGTGSTGKIVDGIAEVLICKGHEVKIAYGYGTAKHPNAVCFGNKRSQIVHKVMSHAFDMQGLCSKKDTQRLINLIINFKPDVINLHNLHGNYLNYPMLFLFLRNYSAKVVWTLHDCWSFTGHCPHFVLCGCEKWKIKCHSCPQLWMYPASNFWDGSRRNYRIKKKCFTSLGDKLTTVAVSDWLGNLVRQSFLGSSRIKIIHNGINLDVFKPANKSDVDQIRKKYKLKDDKIVLAVATPWSKRKGFDDLIKLGGILSNGFRLMMVGLNDEQLRTLPPGIVGIKRTESTEDLAILYSLASVFVNATYEDCFPTVNLEALGCGTPVVTYRTGGSPEAINDQTGIVVTQGDIGGLKVAIETICRSETSMTDNCRNRALDEYSAPLAFVEYVKLFEEVVKFR